MEARGKKGLAKRGDKKKLGGVTFFTVFEYKADIPNTCNKFENSPDWTPLSIIKS